MRHAASIALVAGLAVCAGLAGCGHKKPKKKAPLVEQVEEAEAVPAPPPPALPPGTTALPTEIAEGAAPDAVLSKAGAPVILPLFGKATIDDVRDGGLSIVMGADRYDIALRLAPDPDPGLWPPFVKAELIGIEYHPLPPISSRSLDLVLRRGKDATAQAVQFLRMRSLTPAVRYLADGQIQVEQVGGPHLAKEGTGKTAHGLSVAVTVAGKRAVFEPGSLAPLTLRQGAADLYVATSLLRGGTSTPQEGVPPYTLVLTVVPSSRQPDTNNPVGPGGQTVGGPGYVPQPPPLPAPAVTAPPARPAAVVKSAPITPAKKAPIRRRPIKRRR